MTDPRTALEEAWNVIHDHQVAPWQKLAVADGVERFRRFLDAEAWTSAAEMLVPDGWGWNVSQPNAKAIASGLLKKHTPVRGEVENGFEQRFIVAGETPALALAAACLKAKEAGDA